MSYSSKSGLIWTLSQFLGLYYSKKSKLWCCSLQGIIVCLNLASLLGRIEGKQKNLARKIYNLYSTPGGLDVLQNAKEALPALYNLLTLLMASSYLFFVHFKVIQCREIMDKFNEIDFHLKFQKFENVWLLKN